jgi:hypothetical protein
MRRRKTNPEDPRLFRVSRTFANVSEDSAHDGAYSRTGWVFRDRPMELRQVLRELEGCFELSTSSRDLTGREWATANVPVSMRVGAILYNPRRVISRQESVHIRDRNGEYLKPRTLARIFQLAGLM